LDKKKRGRRKRRVKQTRDGRIQGRRRKKRRGKSYLFTYLIYFSGLFV